jgi:hypothetical protein
MRSPDSDELLTVWERGLAEKSVARGLALLELVHPDMSADAIADLSIGVRDGMLLDLRELLFGRKVVGLIECPACGDTLQTEVATSDLRATPRHEPLEIRLSNYELNICSTAVIRSQRNASGRRSVAAFFSNAASRRQGFPASRRLSRSCRRR